MAKKTKDKSQTPGSARVAGCFAWLLLLALLGGGGYWGYRQWRDRPQEVVETGSDRGHLKKGFEEAMENRRLEEADLWIRRLASSGADEETLRAARARVAGGRAEERGQEIAYLLLNARAALEAGELEEAEELCRRVERLEENHPGIGGIREAVRTGRKAAKRASRLESLKAALAKEDWVAAEKELAGFEKENPGDPRLGDLRSVLAEGKEEARMRRQKAAQLVDLAESLDDGTYSGEAVRLLEEAVRLAPSAENKALYRKMSAYGRLLNVPGDHATITAALRVAEPNDRILVAKGIYHESLEIPPGVTLVGESVEGTVIECPAELGAVVTLLEKARSVRLASLTLRHSGLVNDEERFSIIAVDGGEMEGDDLRLVRASGHGVAVLNGGKIKLQRCLITDSGWDGVAVKGEGSHAELIKVRSERNLQHGVDFWDGAGGKVVDSVVSGNGLNGILVIEAKQAVEVLRTKSQKNRELGVVVSGGVGFVLEDCEVDGNLLGGVFLGKESLGIRLEGNGITENGEVGLVVEKGAQIQSEVNNKVEKNEGRQIWRNAVLPQEPGIETGAPPPAPPLENGKDE